MSAFNPKDWNPSYLAYCRSEGVTDPNDLPKPEDRKVWSFQEWMRARKLEYVEANPGSTFCGSLRNNYHVQAFHAWAASLHTKQKTETP